jgi:hypothetical protein
MFLAARDRCPEDVCILALLYEFGTRHAVRVVGKAVVSVALIGRQQAALWKTISRTQLSAEF